MLRQLVQLSRGAQVLRHHARPARQYGAAAAAAAQVKPTRQQLNAARQRTPRQRSQADVAIKHQPASEDLAPAIDRAAKAVGNNGRENLAALLDLASADAKTLSPTDLTSIALSMAKAGVVHRPLLRKIGELSAAQAQDLTSINCATLAWSLAALDMYDRRVFAALARRATHLMDTMSIQVAATMVSAYAKCGDFDRGLFVAVTKHTLRVANGIQPADLTLLTDSLAKAGTAVTGRGVFKAVADRVRGRCADFSIDQLVVIAKVLGQTGYIDDGIRADVEQLVKDRWARLSDQDKDGCRKLMVIFGLANVVVN